MIYNERLTMINKAETVEALQNLEPHIDEDYECGFLTASEFGRLDVRIMERIAELEQ